MKQQIVVIHGGEAFSTHEAYIEFLKTVPIDISREQVKRWKSTLGETLGDDYEVLSPRMPNGFNAKYEEWKIWFERHIPFMRDGVILLGHSLGGIFLAKFLSENDFPKKINATLLVAAPYDAGGDYSLADFVIRGPLERFAKQGGEVYLYHSEDDPIVDSGELEKYKKKLPDATIRVFKDRGHFDQEEFPEIVEDIKKLAVQ